MAVRHRQLCRCQLRGFPCGILSTGVTSFLTRPFRSPRGEPAVDETIKEPKTALNLDELFQQQDVPQHTATVEPVKGDPDGVRITPWIEGVGCLCDLAMKVLRTSIDHCRAYRAVSSLLWKE